MAELEVHQSALLTDLAMCVNRYRLFTPGWYVCVLARVQLSPEEWDALESDPEKPLFNRTVMGLYPPGSTWKLAAAAN